MKRIVLSLVAASVIGMAQTMPVDLPKSKWKLIGISGIYSATATSSSYGTWGAIANKIYDLEDVDYNVTWWNYDGSAMVEQPETNASIGLRIDSGVVYLKGNFDPYSEISPKESMYITTTTGAAPTIKIIFQNSMAGREVYLKLNDNDDTDYYIFRLSSQYTYANPLVLSDVSYDKYQSTTTIQTANIFDLYDANVTDNNVIEYRSGTFTAIDPKFTDTNLTLYTYDFNSWKIYDSRNTNNDFTQFTLGKGYWAKVDVDGANTKNVGFIIDDGGISSVNWATVFANVSNEWNLLAFNKAPLRYATVGVFIKTSDLSGGLRIYDAYGANSIELITGATDDEYNASSYINFAVEQAKAVGKYFDIRAYPADDGTNKGVAIIGAHRFEVNTTAITPLGSSSATDPITSATYPAYGSYMLGIQINPLMASFAGPANVRVQNVDGTTIDVNLSSKDIAGARSEFATAMSAIMIDTDWNSTTNYEAILLAQNKPFGLKETSYYKLFQYVHGGSALKVEGNNTTTIDPLDTTFSNAVTAIDGTYSTTGVHAYISDNTNKTILIASDAANMDLKELSDGSMLRDVFLDDTTLDNNNTKKGPILAVYDGYNLATAQVNYSQTYDGNQTGKVSGTIAALVDDLMMQTAWVRVMPKSGGALNNFAKMGKRLKLLFTAARTPLGIRWEMLDATKSPNNWFDQNDTQTLFWTDPGRGYWAYLDDFTPSTITLTPQVASTSVTAHFDNNLSSAGEGTVNNFLRKTYQVSAMGLAFADVSSSSATLDGKEYPLIDNGTNVKQLDVNSYAYNLRDTGSDHTITFSVSDGLGTTATADAPLGLVKPSLPTVQWSDTGAVTITNTDFTEWYLFDSNLSDDIANWTVSALTPGSAVVVDGNTTAMELKIVTKNEQGLFSNIQGVHWEPVHTGKHVLSSSGDWDSLPGSYIAGDAIAGDTGVELKALSGRTVTLSYTPEKVNNEYRSIGNTLPRTIYVKEPTNGTLLAVIHYVAAFEGRSFYLYDGSTLYKGAFATGHNTEASADTLTVVSQYSNVPAQPIIKPAAQ